jgi:hypothetical protein
MLKKAEGVPSKNDVHKAVVMAIQKGRRNAPEILGTAVIITANGLAGTLTGKITYPELDPRRHFRIEIETEEGIRLEAIKSFKVIAEETKLRPPTKDTAINNEGVSQDINSAAETPLP